MKIRALVVLFVLWSVVCPCGQAHAYGITQKQHWITTWDGYQLDADIFAPTKGATLPVVIFSPSWGIGKIEYLIPAARMARQGYITVTYSARGCFNSTGEINIGEANDMRDVSTIIDYVLKNYPAADPKRIGMAGISLGALRSLRAGLLEPRVRTIVAMSGSADMRTAFYKQNTPNNEWLDSDDISSILADATRALTDGSHAPDVLAWLDSYSPMNDLKASTILGRPLSVYILHSYDDELFEPNPLLEFFRQLPIAEKVIDLNDGNHTFPPAYGCLGLPEIGWTKTYQWFDWYLKGIPSAINTRIKKTRVGLQVFGAKERLYYASWPTGEGWTQAYYLHPRERSYKWTWSRSGDGWDLTWVLTGIARFGRLHVCPSDRQELDVVQSGSGSKAVTNTDGFLPKLVMAHVKTDINALDTAYTMTYESPAYLLPRMIAGIPSLTLSVTPSRPDAQVIAHLYDVDAQGTGTLITHSTWTLRDVTPGARIRLTFEFHAIAYRMAVGHKLALVFDADDKRSGFPDRPAYSVTLHGDDAPVLTVPYTKVKPVAEPEA